MSPCASALPCTHPMGVRTLATLTPLPTPNLQTMNLQPPTLTSNPTLHQPTCHPHPLPPSRADPRRPKHLTIAAAPTAYLMLPPRGRLVPGHCCIVPTEHTPALRSVSRGERRGVLVKEQKLSGVKREERGTGGCFERHLCASTCACVCACVLPSSPPPCPPLLTPPYPPLPPPTPRWTTRCGLRSRTSPSASYRCLQHRWVCVRVWW